MIIVVHSLCKQYKVEAVHGPAVIEMDVGRDVRANTAKLVDVHEPIILPRPGEGRRDYG